jgi:hypothetical protein
MDDGVDFVLRDQSRHEGLVAGLPDDELHALRHRPVEAGREVVEDDDALAGIDECIDHVTADIAGAAGDKNCNSKPSLPLRVCTNF